MFTKQISKSQDTLALKKPQDLYGQTHSPQLSMNEMNPDYSKNKRTGDCQQSSLIPALQGTCFYSNSPENIKSAAATEHEILPV